MSFLVSLLTTTDTLYTGATLGMVATAFTNKADAQDECPYVTIARGALYGAGAFALIHAAHGVAMSAFNLLETAFAAAEVCATAKFALLVANPLAGVAIVAGAYLGHKLITHFFPAAFCPLTDLCARAQGLASNACNKLAHVL